MVEAAMRPVMMKHVFECKRALALLIVMACVTAFQGCAQIGARNRYLSARELAGKFEKVDNARNNGEGYSGYTNEDGYLAWGESYILESYLTMYEATGDTAWLDKFVAHAKRVVGSTDSARGISDYKGRSLFGWSSQKYSKPQLLRPSMPGEPSGEYRPRVVLWGHTGMIVYPFVKFAEIVDNNNELQKKYKHDADYFTQAAEQAVKVFNDNWRYSGAFGIGYYVVDADEPVEWNYNTCRGHCTEPINRDLGMGRVMVGLCVLTSKREYCQKATALATYFKNVLALSAGRYIWNTDKTSTEDISHGAVDAGFAFDAYRAWIVFTKEDMERFARTLTMAYDGSEFSKRVNGTEEDDPVQTFGSASGRWLDFSTVDCGVYRVVYDFMEKNYFDDKRRASAQVLPGIANLVKYRDACVGALQKK